MPQLSRKCWFGTLIVVVCLALGAVTSSRAAGLTTMTSTPGSRDLSGRWFGSYVCSQARTGLELSLEAAKDGRLSGKFIFFALPSNPNAQSGSFYVNGTYDSNANKLTLRPGKWIVRPEHYSPVGLNGGYASETSSNNKLTEHIKGVIPGCGPFDVHRVASDAVPPSYAPESASITMPDCAQMTAFALTLRGAKSLPYPGSVPAPFQGANFTKLFGVPAFSWTTADLAAANYALNSCMDTAQHANQQREFAALGALDSDLHRIQQAKIKMNGLENKFDTTFGALLALPPTREQLMALVMLDRAYKERADKTGISLSYWKWFDSVSRPYFMWRDGVADSNLLNTKAFNYAWDLTNQIGEYGDWISTHMYPTLTEKRAGLSTAVIASEMSKLAASPETLDGLNTLEAMAEKYMKVDRLFLGPADIRALAKAKSDRQTQIGAILERNLEVQIAAVTDDTSGLNQLNMVSGGAVFAALEPQQREAVIARVGQRSNAILDTISAKDIAHLATYPHTLDGLSELTADTRKIHSNSTVIGQVRMARFDAAAETRAATIGNAALPTFRKMLAIVPETNAGLAQINAITAKYEDVFGVLPPDLKRRYLNALEVRKGEINAAITAESARLAALPLVGGVFEDKKIGVTLTFRNSTHAILAINSKSAGSATGNAMYDVTWEQDGTMVILHGTPEGSPIFLRQGDALVGNGLDLVRLAAGKKDP